MGGPVCTLAGEGRHSISTILSCLNLVLSLAGHILILVALFLKFVLEPRVAVVIGNHAGALAYFLIAVGFILCFVCMASSKVSYDAGVEEKATPRTSKMLVFTQFCQILVLVLVFSAIIMCLVHKGLIRDALHSGIIAAIKLYRVKPNIKRGIDKIQSTFHCCGSRSFADWFKIPWVPMKFVNVDHPAVSKHIVDGDFIKDDAPFSCCNIFASRPCVHHDVTNAIAHPRLGPEGTLYTLGCNDALEAYWKSNVLNPVLWMLLFVFLLTSLVMGLSRLLQTSLEGALDAGGPTEEGEAYCCRTCPCAVLPASDPTKVLAKKDRSSSGDGTYDSDDVPDYSGDGGDTSRDESSHNVSSSEDRGGRGGGGGGGAERGDGGGRGEGQGGGKGGDKKDKKKGKKGKDDKGKGKKGKDDKGKGKKAKDKKGKNKKGGDKKKKTNSKKGKTAGKKKSKPKSKKKPPKKKAKKGKSKGKKKK